MFQLVRIMTTIIANIVEHLPCARHNSKYSLQSCEMNYTIIIFISLLGIESLNNFCKVTLLVCKVSGRARQSSYFYYLTLNRSNSVRNFKIVIHICFGNIRIRRLENWSQESQLLEKSPHFFLLHITGVA